MNRLTSIESSRIVSVLDEVLHKLHAVRGRRGRLAPLPGRCRRPSDSPAGPPQLGQADFRHISDDVLDTVAAPTAEALQRQVRAATPLDSTGAVPVRAPPAPYPL